MPLKKLVKSDGKRRFTNIYYVGILAFVLAFIIQVLFNGFSVIMRSLPDEMGAVYLAAKVAGMDWEYVMTHPAYYYGSLNFPFLYPFFIFIKDPLLLYQCLLGVGAFLRALSVPICFYIMHNVYKIKNTKLLFIVSIASVFFNPTRSNNIDNEPILILICWIIVLFIILLQQEKQNTVKKYILTVFLVVSLNLSLLAHTRAILYIISIVIVILLYHIFTKKHLVVYRIFVPLFIIIYYFTKKIINILTTYLYPVNISSVTVYNTSENLTTQVGDSLSSLFESFGLQSFLDLFTSNFVIIFVFSAGLMILIFWIYGERFYQALKLRFLSKTALVSNDIFFPLSFCIIGGISTILALCLTWISGPINQHINDGQLTRGYFYLRYYFNFFGPLLMLLFVSIKFNFEKKNKLNLRFCVSGSIISYIFCCIYMWLSFLSRVTYKLPDSTNDWFYYFAPLSMTFTPWPEANQTLSYFIIAMIIALLIFAIIILLYYKKKVICLSVLLMIFFIYQYGYSVYMWDKPSAESENYWQAVDGLYGFKMEESLLFDKLDKVYYDYQIFGPQYLAQFVLGDTPLILLGDDEGIEREDLEDAVILTNYFIDFQDEKKENYKYIPIDKNEFLFVKGEHYQEIFESEGIELIDVSNERIYLDYDLQDNQNISKQYSLDSGTIYMETTSRMFKKGTYNINTIFEKLENEEYGKILIIDDDTNEIIYEANLLEDTSEVIFSLSTSRKVSIKYISLNEDPTPNIEDIMVWRSDYYEVGLENPDNLSELDELFSSYNDINKIICLVKLEEDISVNYLQDNFNLYSVELGNIEQIDDNKLLYIIALKSNMEWINLLDDYTIIHNFEEYLVLAPNTCQLVLGMPLENRLSKERDISISLWEKDEKAGFEQIPAGQYMVTLKQAALFDKDSTIFIQIENDGKIIDTIETKNNKKIKIEFESYVELNDLKFWSYNDDVIEKCEPISLQFLTEPDVFIFDYAVGSLIEYENTLIGSSLFLDEFKELDRYELEYYLTITKGHNNIKTEKNDFETSEWLQFIDSYQKIYLPKKRLDVIFQLLEYGFSIVDKNESYVLLYRGEEPLKDALSSGNVIYNDYFVSVSSTGVIDDTVNIPEGVYRITVEVPSERSDDGVIQLIGNDTVLAEQNLKQDDNFNIIEMYISGYYKKEITDLHIQSSVSGTQIVSVEKLSDGFSINLSTMSCTSTNIEKDNLHFYILDEQASIIFGPYIQLTQGKYICTIDFSTGNDASAAFDVVCDSGNSILAQSNFSNATIDENGQMKIQMEFELTEDVSDIEIRSHIPGSVEFQIDKIIISWDKNNN